MMVQCEYCKAWQEHDVVCCRCGAVLPEPERKEWPKHDDYFDELDYMMSMAGTADIFVPSTMSFAGSIVYHPKRRMK